MHGHEYYHTGCYEEKRRFRKERSRLQYALARSPATDTVAVLRALVASDDTLLQVAGLLTSGRGFYPKPDPSTRSHCVRCHSTYDANYPAGCKIAHAEDDEQHMQHDLDSRFDTPYGACGCEMEALPLENHWERTEYGFVEDCCFEGDHTISVADVEDEMAEAIEAGNVELCREHGCELPAHQQNHGDNDDSDADDD